MDYGNPATSFYGMVVVANQRMTELQEQLLFEFMGDFEMVDKPKKEKK